MSRISATRLNEVITSDAALINAVLEERFYQNGIKHGILYDSMKYSACGGGKRVRPFLTIEVAKALGADEKAALPFACAIECIHTSSLIHDDLPCMDNDNLRRGQPTNHVKFGETIALLAGDALETEAFSFIAENKYVSDEYKVKAVKLLAQRSGKCGMLGGQMLDSIGESQKFDYETLLEMNRMKTGCLITAAAILGCYAAESNDTDNIIMYSENIGLCFQLTDDILDAEEENEDKTTFLSFMTVEEARKKAQELTESAKRAIKTMPNNEILSEFADYLLNRVI